MKKEEMEDEEEKYIHINEQNERNKNRKRPVACIVQIVHGRALAVSYTIYDDAEMQIIFTFLSLVLHAEQCLYRYQGAFHQYR